MKGAAELASHHRQEEQLLLEPVRSLFTENIQ